MKEMENAKIFPEYVKIEEPYSIDENVILGYRPGRDVKDLDLRMGESATVRFGTVIYAGSTIGVHLETGHNVVIREENKIGDHFNIWNCSVVDYGCTIGNNVKVHNHVYIAQFTAIEDNVFIAPGVIMANDPHPICTKCMKGPTIKKNARIGVNVTILPHVTIGEGALIGAGSVVTRDVPSRKVVVGNPAKVLKRTDELKCQFGFVDQPYLDGVDVKGREGKA